MKKWVKRSAIVLGALLVLAVILFVVATSDTFVRKVILPQAGKAIGEPVRAETVSFSPRRHLLIGGLQVGDSDDFRISIPEVAIRYRLLPLLRGDLVVEEIRISNFDGSVKRLPDLPEKKERKKKKKKKDGEPSRISIANVVIEQANLVYAPAAHPGEILEIRNFNLRIPQLANGSDFKIGIACGLRLKRGAADISLETVDLAIKGALDAEMLPSRLQAALVVGGAAGIVGGIDLADRRVDGEVDLTWRDGQLAIKQFMFSERLGEVVEASLRVDGGLGFAPPAGHVNLAVDIPDPSLLNLAGGFAGDYDFGKTSATLRARIGSGDKALRLKFDGALTVKGATFASAGLGIVPVSPLDLAIDWAGSFDVARLQAALEKANLRVVDGHEIIGVSFAAPGGMPLSGAVRELPPAASLTAKIERLDLASYTAALPNVPALRGIAGIVDIDVALQPGDGDGDWQGEGSLRLRNLRCPQLAGAPPLDAGVSFAGSYPPDGLATIQRLAVTLAQSGQENILDLLVAGRVDTALRGGKSELSLESRRAIRVEDLLALAPVADKASGQSTPASGTAQPVPAPAPTETKESGLPPGLWLALSAKIPEISHGQISATDLNLSAEYKDGILRIPQSTFVFSGKPGSVAAEVDLRDPSAPACTGTVNFGYIAVGPFIAAFKPDFPVGLEGGLNDLALSFAARGSDPERIRQTMQADLSYGIDRFAVVSMPSWASLLSGQLLALLGLRPDDLRFEGGLGKLSLKDGRLTVSTAEFNAALWRLKAAGTMAIGGEPDFTITPFFRGASANRLADEKIPLENAADGFKSAPPIVLRGPVWEKLHAARLITDYAASLGKIDKEAQAVGEGLGILQDAIRKTQKGEKLDLEETTKGVQGIIDLFEKKK